MFIEKNGIILDKKIIRKEQMLVKKLMNWEINQIMRKYGFVKKNNKNNTFSNDEVFLECYINMKSKL